jgi:hypothetical protein
MYETRLNEKDKTIESLQDIIQNYLYIGDGEPWLKKYKTIEDSQMKQWSDSAYNASPDTPDKNDVVTTTNDTQRLEAVLILGLKITNLLLVRIRGITFMTQMLSRIRMCLLP